MPKLKKKKSRTAKYLIPLIAIAAIVILAVGGMVAYRIMNPTYTYTIYDQGRSKVVESHSQDLAVVLREARTFLSENDEYTVEKAGEHTNIHIRRAYFVMINVQGETQKVYTYGETVEQLLTRLGIGTQSPWRVSEPLDAQTYNAMTITVDYVEEISETTTRDLQYSTVYCYDPSMPEGEEELLVEGICGKQDTVTTAVYVNGVKTSVSVVENTPTEKPTHQIVAVGTGENVGQERKYPLFGDKVIVTADGKYLYYSRMEIFEATGYSSWIDDVGDITACGTKARVGAVAVDPTVIPYFTKMYIVSQDGVYDYGEASAEDCGGVIKGKIIDLFFDTEAECWQFGRRDIEVYFLTDELV